jgi:hypothetical protein
MDHRGGEAGTIRIREQNRKSRFHHADERIGGPKVDADDFFIHASETDLTKNLFCLERTGQRVDGKGQERFFGISLTTRIGGTPTIAVSVRRSFDCSRGSRRQSKSRTTQRSCLMAPGPPPEAKVRLELGKPWRIRA